MSNSSEKEPILPLGPDAVQCFESYAENDPEPHNNTCLMMIQKHRELIVAMREIAGSIGVHPTDGDVFTVGMGLSYRLADFSAQMTRQKLPDSNAGVIDEFKSWVEPYSLIDDAGLETFGTLVERTTEHDPHLDSILSDCTEVTDFEDTPAEDLILPTERVALMSGSIMMYHLVGAHLDMDSTRQLVAV